MNSLTTVAAGVIQHRHSLDGISDGGIRWLLMKPWMCSIGQCALHRIAASTWLKLPAIYLPVNFVVAHNLRVWCKPGWPKNS